jgi:hypothetical protein
MTHLQVGEPNAWAAQPNPNRLFKKAAIAGALALSCCLLVSAGLAKDAPAPGNLRGVTRSAQGMPLAGVQVRVHCVQDNTDRLVVSDDQGIYLAANLPPGRYELRAAEQGMGNSDVATVDLRSQEDLQVDMILVPLAPAALRAADDAPLTEREKALLERVNRLEERLAAMEAKLSGPAPAEVTAATPSQPLVASLGPLAALAVPQPVPVATASPAPLPLATGKDRPAQAAQSAPAATQHVLPEALEAPDPAPPNSDNVYTWADYTWLNGTSRNKDTILDTKYFTPEVRFDTNFMDSFNQPKDHTMGGSTESFRSGEFQVEQASVGGDFHWQNVRGRILTMFGMFAATTPRNDASPGVGEWDVRTAYRYVSEAYGGYHFNVNRGLNVDAGIFVSYVGLFSYYNFDNWAYQPSYVSSNTPWFFSGLRIQWFPTKKLKIEPWIINGWQTYNLMNNHHGLGGQVLYRPAEWVSLVFNNYGNGTDTLGNPGRSRIHTDDSVEVRYFNRPKSNGIDKMAFSLTGDMGCEYGGGVSCTGNTKDGPKQAFLGWMAYNRVWWGHDKYAITYGGGKMSNPGRYLTLLPPIDGADAVSGSPYFTANPGDKAHMWDTTLTFQWMPREYITWWLETGYRHADVPYFTGRGGITPPGGNNGSPQYYTCVSGATAGTADLAAATTTCGGPGTVWFPDLRKTQGAVSAGVMVKF